MGSGRTDSAPLRVRKPLQLALATASACALLVGCLSWLSHSTMQGTSVEKTTGFYAIRNRSNASAANGSLLAGAGPANETLPANCKAGNCTVDLLGGGTGNESGRAGGRRDDTARSGNESGVPNMSIIVSYDLDNASSNASSPEGGARNASNESNASGARSAAANTSSSSTHSTDSNHSANNSGGGIGNISSAVNGGEHGDCSCWKKATQCQANDTGSVSSEQLEQWVRQYYVAWNNHSKSAVVARFDANATSRTWNENLSGAESIGKATQDIFDASPNATLNVLQVYPSPPMMAASARVQIVMRGEQHLVEVVDFFRFRSDGMIRSLQGSLQEVTNMLSSQVNLIIKELPTNCNDLYIYRRFAPFGAVRDAKAILAEDGTCTGVGLVAFMRASDAARAIEHLDGLKQQDGTHMRVSVNEHPPREDTPEELIK